MAQLFQYFTGISTAKLAEKLCDYIPKYTEQHTHIQLRSTLIYKKVGKYQ